MRVHDFEMRVLALEGFRVVIRAPDGEEVADYDFANRAADGMRLSSFYRLRLAPYVGDREVVVLLGNGRTAGLARLVRTVRESYD